MNNVVFCLRGATKSRMKKKLTIEMVNDVLTVVFTESKEVFLQHLFLF